MKMNTTVIFFLGGRSDCDLFADSQYGTFGGDVDLSLWLSGWNTSVNPLEDPKGGPHHASVASSGSFPSGKSPLRPFLNTFDKLSKLDFGGEHCFLGGSRVPLRVLEPRVALWRRKICLAGPTFSPDNR